MISSFDQSNGILSMPTGSRETPIFTLSRMNIKLNQDIEQLVISNRTMVVLMGNVLHRIYLGADQEPIDKLAAFPVDVRVVRMFLDPRGSHLLLTVRMTGVANTKDPMHELWYLHRTSRSPKRCDLFRGHEITAIAWNSEHGTDATTSSILLGTSQGLILEAEFSYVPGEKKSVISPYNWKQLPNYLPLYGSHDVDGVIFDIGKGESCPITGIEFHKAPSTSRYIVMMTTPNRMYTFYEELRCEERHPYLHNIFASYLNKIGHSTHDVGISGNDSVLRFLYELPNNLYPRMYIWLTSVCMTIGEITPTADSSDFLKQKITINFPTNANNNVPIAVELTEFHILLLYTDHVCALERLTHSVAYEQYFDELLGLTRDQRAGVIYLFSRKEIMRVRVRDEQRNVWRQYLELGDFVRAQQSTHSAANLNQILIQEADVCFMQKNYNRAAILYAESRTCFETICLKMLREIRAGGDNEIVIAKRSALLVFVRQRLEKLKPDDKTQITMLVLWLVKLYVTEISAVSHNNADDLNRFEHEFHAFLLLPRIAECVRANLNVIYGLLGTHGDMTILSMLRTQHTDYNAVIQQHIEHGAFTEALKVLRSLNNNQKPALFYQYAPILMEQVPKQTSEVLRAQDDILDAEQLLPALMYVETEIQRTEVIRYLEWSIHKMACKSQAIHNYLITLYAQWKPDRLMNYLNNEGTDEHMVHYDIKFALRICNKHKCSKACVFLYGLLNMWQPAVDLALTFDAELAEQTVTRATNPAVQRQLWLRIANHRIRGCNDVRQALHVLNKCDGLLRIEDLLPIFNDFDRIDHFKKAVIDALRQSNDVVQRYCEEMDESAKAAELVRNELQMFRQRSVRIEPEQQCASCRSPLLLRQFFMFQCGHMFHVNCMEHEVVKHMSTEDKVRLAILHNRMEIAPALSSSENAAGQLPDHDCARIEYEELVSAECILCGNYLIESIDRPFDVENSLKSSFFDQAANVEFI